MGRPVSRVKIHGRTVTFGRRRLDDFGCFDSRGNDGWLWLPIDADPERDRVTLHHEVSHAVEFVIEELRASVAEEIGDKAFQFFGLYGDD